MIESSQVVIDGLVIHHVGSHSEGQPIRFSKGAINLQDNVEVGSLLKTYFFNAFKNEGYYTFIGAEEGAAGLVYNLAVEVFSDKTKLYNASVRLAEHLYEHSSHPKIRGGEFYVALFSNVAVDGIGVDALGIFKSENKDSFLKVYLRGQDFELGAEEGINIRKLDKGCIIFNTEAEHGFKVVMVDNVNKGNEAAFWKDDFLGLQPREDAFFYTRNYLDLCKNFVREVYNGENQVPKPEQIDFLNRSIDFFDKKGTFRQDDFEREVIRLPEVTEAFNDYRNQFETERGIPLNDSFDIAKTAVKSEKKYFKSVLKLDKNFHVYVHGKRDFIEKGYDDNRGLNYYKLYFENEL